jgi:hypothetical protein
LARGGDINVLDLKVEEFGALFLAQQIDKDIDLCSIIDGIIPLADRETGPSLGEYFLYCVYNRMVHAVKTNSPSGTKKRLSSILDPLIWVS